MKALERIIEEHRNKWDSDNFEDWKITEVMYCKIGWCIDALDGSDELEEKVNILLNIQSFIEDLQKIEKR
tara:strand:- start:1486 stop:1695 length:210 start_codon:yes stop_codon:yes gene_type:complete